jgi:hypothetical protein
MEYALPEEKIDETGKKEGENGENQGRGALH